MIKIKFRQSFGLHRDIRSNNQYTSFSFPKMDAIIYTNTVGLGFIVLLEISALMAMLLLKPFLKN